MPEVLINGPVGRIESRYSHSIKPKSPSILILHAHPGHGGNMNNEMPVKLHKNFSDIGFSTLRFNFRGVGRSDGDHDGSEGELSDSAIALDWIQSQNQSTNEYWICGISFGAWIGMQLLMRRPEITRFILLGPPAGKYDFNFLAPCPSSGLIFSGEKDNLIDHSILSNLVKRLNNQKNIEVKHEILKGSDHFFSNYESNIIQKINNYVKL